MSEFIERRRREIADLAQIGDAMAHEAYRKALRAGQDLDLKTPRDVLDYGVGLLRGRQTNPTTGTRNLRPSEGRSAPRPSPRTVERPQRDATRQGWLDRSPTAKAVAGEVGEKLGYAEGLARGAYDGVTGLANGALFGVRVMNPEWDGGAAALSAASGVMNAGKSAVDYMRNGVAHPESVVSDLKHRADQYMVDVDPVLTPVAPTFAGEFSRRRNIGVNQGKVAFDVGSWVFGGPEAKAVGRIADMRELATPAKYIAQGFSPKAAAYLAEPYEGMGHHFGPRRMGLPSGYSESEFNVLKPGGISRGDFYELHYKVDPKFQGTGLSRELPGESWSGRSLGLKKFGFPERVWHGSPGPLKARSVGVVGAAGVAHGDDAP